MTANDKSMSGRVCLITGANTGIGKETALALAAKRATVILACRSRSRTQTVLDEIDSLGGEKARFIELDLGSLDSVRTAAEEFLALGVSLDVLINNAGLAGHKGETSDGFEITFGVNHLGHFLWTIVLADALKRGTNPRLVNVASKAHYGAKELDFNRLRQPTSTRTGYPEYQVSKLCNVLFSAEFARRVPSVKTYSLHPGVIASDVWRKVPWPFRSAIKLFMKNTTDGAATTIHCASSDKVADETGLYYDECKTRTASSLARDKALAAALWQKSVEWTGTDLPQ